jgi:hypothetical protein
MAKSSGSATLNVTQTGAIGKKPSFHVGDRGGRQDPLLKNWGDLARGSLGSTLKIQILIRFLKQTITYWACRGLSIVRRNLPPSGKTIQLFKPSKMSFLFCSVPDPRHFGRDPYLWPKDPDADAGILGWKYLSMLVLFSNKKIQKLKNWKNKFYDKCLFFCKNIFVLKLYFATII